MFRKWFMAIVVLAAAPLASLVGAEPADTKTDPVLQKLDQILSRLSLLERKVDALDLGRLESTREARDLKAQIGQLQFDVADLRSQMGGQRSTSAKFGPGFARAMGTVRVFNDYPMLMSVTVNNATYELIPGETRNIPVPSGGFLFQVHGVHPVPLTRTVAEGKTYVTRIHPLGQ